MQNEIIEGFRLSPQQTRLWKLQPQDGSDAYRTRCLVLVEGELDRTSFDAALRNVVERHEILRTTFHLQEATAAPLQVINESGLALVREFDLSDLPPSSQQARVAQMFDDASRAPFNPGDGQVFRVDLITLSTVRQFVLLTLPSLCADAGTLVNLVRELGTSYAAAARGESLADEPLQYADLSEWQNELLESEETAIGRRYWNERSVDEFTTLRHALSGQAAGDAFDPRSLAIAIEPETANRISEVAAKHGITRETFLLACWQTLLCRITGRTDITVSVAFNGRQAGELAEAVGPLTRYVPVQTTVGDEQRFSEVLEQVSEAAGASGKWQEFFSWEQLDGQHEMNPEATFLPLSFSYTPRVEPQAVGGVVLTIQKLSSDSDRFHVKLAAVETTDGIVAEFRFDSALLSEASIGDLAGQYRQLLESACAAPETQVCKLDIVNGQERRRLISDFNDTRVAYPADTCIHELVEEQARRTPDNVAIVFEEESLTYAELNARANQLASYLRGLGVGPEVPVGICIDRSWEMIVGLLGILKAGGAYVPLDPGYPAERLSFMLDDTKLPVLLTQRLAESIPSIWGHTIFLDSEWDVIAQESVENVQSGVTADNLAYVIYTSGSTGTPKGTLLHHRGLCNLVHAQTAAFRIDSASCLLQFASLSFDASVSEIFTALASGARLCLAPSDSLLPGAGLSELIRRHGVTTLTLPPSVLSVLDPDEVQGLKTLVTAGEACPAELARKWATGETRHFINAYGPTETTVCATMAEIPADVEGVPPIGRPMANMEVYVLDRHRELVPAGVEGELFIGGAGLARGYLNRPELTAERFVPHPFSTTPGARLYRTGDTGRYRNDGQLEYVGRGDAQVKIRGFRIELGEVEAVLREHSGVAEAVVIAREDEGNREKRMVAYIVSNGAAEELTVGELRSHMKRKVPEHMIPAGFVMLAEMPLTVNGKIDRKALPAPEPVRPELEEVLMLPRSPVEEVVASIWSQVLGIGQIGINDNFFELGGHSLLATQVISRLREAFQIDVALPTLFESPTVAGLAVCIESAQRAAKGLNAPPVLPISRDGELALSFTQERLWFLDQLNPGNIVYNLHRSLRLKGALDVPALEATLNEIARRHEILRTTFQTINGKPCQVIGEETKFDLEAVNLEMYPEDEREAVALKLGTQEARRPFDLATGPLLRVSLLRLEEEDHVVLFTMHHIISDGWSMGVLIREVTMLYEAFVEGRRSPLAELPVQYADFAHWQREWLSGEVFETHLNYWKHQLDGIPAALPLRTDRERTGAQSYEGARQFLTLSKSASEALKTISRSEDVTLFMMLLAVFNVLLQYHSDSDDIVVGTDVANRSRSETESVIGFFINQLVLRTDLSGNPTFTELVKRVRQVSLEAYAHQDLPFDRLVEVLNPERNLSHNPLFQVMFGFQSLPPQKLELSGLTLSGLSVENEKTVFDLALYMSDTPAGLIGTWTYHTDLFEAATITRMSEHFETLLSRIVEQPDITLEELQAHLAATDRERDDAKRKEFLENRRKKLKNVRQKFV